MKHKDGWLDEIEAVFPLRSDGSRTIGLRCGGHAKLTGELSANVRTGDYLFHSSGKESFRLIRREDHQAQMAGNQDDTSPPQ